MRFGFHISIGGGFHRVAERAKRLGCQTIQIFSHNPRQWKSSSFNEDEVKTFKGDIAKEEIHPVFVHMPYLPNLASPEENLYSKSVESLCQDLIRTGILAIPYLVIHLGSKGSSDEGEALARISRAINEVFVRVRNRVIILLENTAGQGTEVGYTFSQIKAISDQVEDKNRIGVCLDTAHAFEAGYDLSRAKGLEETIEDFDRLIGLEKLYLIHLNDSKTPLGSCVDRHWHIGEGHIGMEGFRRIVNHCQLSHLPAIMETPRQDDGDDFKNMSVVKRLIGTRNVNRT